MRKIIYILITIVLLINTVDATTIEEFVDSYDFSYIKNDMRIENLTYFINETILNLSIKFYILNNNYDVYYSIYSNESNLEIQNNSKRILNDNTKLSLKINLSLLNTNNYTFSLIIENDNMLIYRNYSLFNFSYISKNNITSLKHNRNFLTIEEFNKLNYSFEKEKEFLPDIFVSNYSFINNTLIFNIKNKGESDIGIFYFIIYNDELDLVYESKINLIEKNNYRKIEIKTNYSKSFLISLDSFNYHKEIDKSNNLFFSPNEEKIIVNKKKIISSGGGSNNKENKIIKKPINNIKKVVNNTDEIIVNNITKKENKTVKIIKEIVKKEQIMNYSEKNNTIKPNIEKEKYVEEVLIYLVIGSIISGLILIFAL